METQPPFPCEVTVVDDCSPQFDLRELVGDPFRVVRNEHNLGFAGTCNYGASLSHGKYLLFLNSDTEAQAGWAEPLVRAFDDATVGLVGAKLLFPDGSIQSAGGLFDAGRGPYHRYLGYDGGFRLANVPEKVSWLTGACQMLPRQLFYQVGGYDEGYKRGYFEDVDLCMKVKAAGKSIWYEPRSVFTHHVGQSTATKTPEAQREAAQTFRRNSWRFHARWDAQITPDVREVHVNY